MQNFFLFLLLSLNLFLWSFDATIVGFARFADGIGRHPIGWIEALHKDCKINFISTRPNWGQDFTDIPNHVARIINDKNKNPGKIAIFVDILAEKNLDFTTYLPDSSIKFAFSVFESTAIPSSWVNILNTKFDGVIVPDEFLVIVYKNSGVNIPIFVLPWGAYLEEFLVMPAKTKKNKEFTFGMSASFYSRKNQDLLIDAFIKEFGNNKKVKLIIHGRGGSPDYIRILRNKISKKEIKNISIICRPFTRAEYLNFMTSLDCYVFPSKGEGFSITPREALAFGLPCILSDNTVHRTICATGLVRAVRSNITEIANYEILGQSSGYFFNSTLSDLSAALKDVYSNYNKYLKIAARGRDWVKQYLFSNLKNRYVSLIKPKKILFGDKNVIESEYIITNSKNLYDKYLALENL